MARYGVKENSMALLFIAAGLLSGCSGWDTRKPALAAALGDDSSKRIVSVYLLPDADLDFRPTYIDRIISARPRIVQQVVNAEAVVKVQGIRTKIIGSSCVQLQQKYPDIKECAEVEREMTRFGDPVSSVATDSEGFAVLTLGEGVYQLATQSWTTKEDKKCSWGGSALLPEGSVSLELPIHVFCE